MKLRLKAVSNSAIAIALIAAAGGARAAGAELAEADADIAADEIIVTGTRASGITALESAAPIKVLGAEAMENVGQPNLNQVLTQLVPSFTAQAFGGDTANLTLSARLRGLSPNHTLVLINGKRRHGTANLAVLGGPYQGAATADLDLITPASIKRIEVLEDGAAAQYGSDAIGGVINIILKDTSEGLSGSATAGEHYDTGGATYAGSVHLGTPLGDSGFVNVTLFHRYHDFTQIGGIDRRVTDINGVLLSPTSNPAISAQQQALYRNIPGFPYVNKINGDAESHLTNAQFNSAYDFGGVEVYAFGTYSKRIASAFENYRVPDRVRRSPVLGVAGTLTTPGEILFNPLGFHPREKIREDDYAGTFGARGDLGGVSVDLSVTHGEDKNLIYTVDSANASLFVDTGFTPTDFYNGFFKARETTVNADFSKEVEMGWSGPTTIAVGLEHRKNLYEIGPGDPGSIYKEGGQSYPGFRPSDAGAHTRNNEAIYLDVAAMPTAGLKINGAVRYEDYSDFGGTTNFKGSVRYDISDAAALRGTISTGFRAPTLAESYYSATNVSPTAAFVQLPANSAAAKLIGFQDLDPEKSTNFSLGTVLRPADGLSITVDAYQIRIRDRILGTGSIFGSGGATNFPVVTTAIVANGNILDPTVSQTGINIFTNGANTRTRGLDIVASYPTDLGDYGSVLWTLAANYNKTKITKLSLAPATLTAAGAAAPIPLFDAAAVSNIESASPRTKVVSSATWDIGAFSTNLRGTLYGTSSNFTSPNGGTFYKQKIGSAAIIDLEASYAVNEAFEISLGANNLFNKRPPTVAVVPGSTNGTLVNGGNVFDAPLTFSPYGINGGYYYARINFDF